MKHTLFIPIACAAMLAPAAAQDAPAAAYEQGALLNAADLLPAGMLRGTSHRVREQVATDGFMAHFEIDTDFGTFDAVGVPQAKSRIVEADAIRKLVETSKGDLFAEGLKRSINQPIDAVKNIVKDPVRAAKQAPKTVGHFFSKIGTSIQRGAERAGEQIHEASTGEVDSGTAASQAGRGIGEAAKNAAGFDKARLDTAKQLGVDPYSDNARLQEEIDKVTWAFFAGGLPLRIGAAVASAGVAVAATNMVGIPDDTYALTQAELTLRDAKSLSAMGVSEADIKAFQLSRILSTTRRHRIVTSLADLSHARGRGDIVQLASSCSTAGQADFLIGALAILVERQRGGAADYVALSVLGRLPGATTAAGALEVPAPVDHVTWTGQVADFAKRDDLGTAPKMLVHTGTLSPATTAGFAAAGWQTLGVAYPHGR
ncbi:MAG: hypothetical protein Q8Q59_13200 [Luteolibacter sp.]|jgi:hypothetical protein|nr:hypothetical protein [Luteolibacter sp.]